MNRVSKMGKRNLRATSTWCFRDQKWLPVIVALVGVGILELEGNTASSVGDLWSCLQPIGFGNSIVGMELLIKSIQARNTKAKEKEKKREDEVRADVVAIAGIRALWLCVCSCVCACVSWQTMGQVYELIEEPMIVRNLLWVAVVCTAGGWFLQTLVQSKVRAQDFSLILSTEPIFATMMAGGNSRGN